MGNQHQRVIMLADCQSFYASVEKAANPQYANKPLVVAGDPERRSGIVLAACPMAKKYGVTTAERVGEAIAKCPDLIVIKPRMQTYIEISMQITEIYRSYSDLVEPYSIDEQFIDVTGSQRIFGDPLTIAAAIQERVWNETRVKTRLGISFSKVTAKMACDNFAKKSDSGLFTLTKEGMTQKLWPLDIGKLFMVGSRMMAHFHTMGLPTIGALAQTPLGKLKEMMRRKFRKNCDIDAELYWRIANGIDDSPVSPYTHSEAPKSIGHQMTLPRDYATLDEIKVVLLELSELVCLRCRSLKYMGSVVSVGCQGADFDRPTGFYRQMKIPDPTNVTNHVYKAVVQLFQQHWDGLPVRKVAVGISQLSSEESYQLTMFEERDRFRELERTTDELKRRFGETAIVRAVSATSAGQAADRAKKIGGHYR
ncbi:DNA polymerase IV [Paenibacillus hexagrammi]|uniref:DNA polymerase IV n=1 Tax=Paenibacillus hexagrammi TaxID=2908839 RepID=A0ABY3SGU7_9BACL|nr:DNA polymerase IV [Paenibacillus sp. YPD9-1]UJF32157.1 DNA polymerase IV [Paenibacillus sp. YPD9-1]